MNVENALNFCNQYLMMKVLVSSNSDQKILSTATFDKQQQVKKKKIKGQRFQNHIKKAKQIQTQENPTQTYRQISERTKKKPKKFENPITNRKQIQQNHNLTTQRKQRDQQSGYVPIQSLLNGLLKNPDNKSKQNNNFVSFGPSEVKQRNYIYERPDNYNFNAKTQYKVNKNQNVWNDWNNNYDNYSKLDKYDEYWMNRQTKNTYNTLNQFSLNPSRSQYFYESPIKKFNQQTTVGYQVPVSRSKSKSPLGHSKSGSDLTSNSVNKSLNIKKKKKNTQRSFFLPSSCSNASNQNEESSQINITNNTISRLQRQLLEKSRIRNQQFQSDNKSKVSETHYEEKVYKKDTSMIRQLDDYSAIQLDLGVRQSLSFLSQVRGPTKPIPIHMKK